MVAKGGAKLPKGCGEVPAWWLELCPHDIYESPEENARMKSAYEESQIFARVPDSFKQQYGGDDFPNWNPAEHGPMGDEMTRDWESKGYRRDPSSNKWVGKDGKPLEGRQFTIKPPAGYKPGAFGGGGSRFGGAGLKSRGGGGYANDKTAWEKPAWTTKQLRSTKPKTPAAGGAAGGPTKTPGKIAAPAWAKGGSTNKPAEGKVGKPSWVK